MFEDYIKLNFDEKYAVASRFSEKQFILLEKGAKLIFDELVRIEDTSCDKNKICPAYIGIGYLENGNFIDKIKPLCDLAKTKCELDARKSI